MSTTSKRGPGRKSDRTEWVDRWSPPKPRVGLQAIETVLNRHTSQVTPESRLVVALIALAIHDGLSRANSRLRRRARHFLLGDDLTLWCDLVGLDPDFVRFVARRAGYLADEEAHWRKVPIKVPVRSVSTKSVTKVPVPIKVVKVPVKVPVLAQSSESKVPVQVNKVPNKVPVLAQPSGPTL